MIIQFIINKSEIVQAIKIVCAVGPYIFIYLYIFLQIRPAHSKQNGPAPLALAKIARWPIRPWKQRISITHQHAASGGPA